MAIDPYTIGIRMKQNSYDDFKLKNPFDLHSLYTNNSAL